MSETHEGMLDKQDNDPEKDRFNTGIWGLCESCDYYTQLCLNHEHCSKCCKCE
jgi:hypothetical protein